MSVSLINGHIDDEMTDEQIIKALERCKIGNDCASCEYEPIEYKKGTVGCCCELMEDALDLINRQKAEKETMQSYIDCLKAEIERLKYSAELWEGDARQFFNERQIARAEAVKEFAERLKEYINGIIERHEMPMFPFSVAFVSGMETKIDNLVKEMVGEG